MSAELVLDTDVRVYTFDQSEPLKQRRAIEIVEHQSDGAWTISWQVIQEFSGVALHRFARPMPAADLREWQRTLFWAACGILPDRSLHAHALALHDETQYRYDDCPILAAAIASEAETHYSEDLQHGRTLGGVRIINPFA